MNIFKFKLFDIVQDIAPLKVGTDAMLLGAFAGEESFQNDSGNGLNILDIGTGTGVLALMMAQCYKMAQVEAIDKDSLSIEEAALNFRNAPFSDRLKASCIGFEDFNPSIKYDLIISNPPFYSSGNYPNSEKNKLAKHEGKFKLLDWIKKAVALLNEDGEFWVIIPYIKAEWIINEMSRELILLHKRINIYGKKDNPNRAILVFKTRGQTDNTTHFSITIRDEKGNYTQAYKKLTKDFHFKKL